MAGAWQRLANRHAMRRARRGPAAAGLALACEPLSPGCPQTGARLVAGQMLFGGTLVEAPGQPPWDLAATEPGFAAQAEGFGWLDDLAALGGGAARATARGWTAAWIARDAARRGPDWQPHSTGRRLLAWLHHAEMLLAGEGAPEREALFGSASAQLRYLARRWPQAAPGPARIEALAGLVCGALALPGAGVDPDPAEAALAREAARLVGPDGTLPGRSPEALLDLLARLVWVAQVQQAAGRPPRDGHSAAMARIVPCLRALRHADGALPRFHGGDRGAEGLCDRLLATLHQPPGPPGGGAMGYVRLRGGRATVIVDAAPPPPQPPAPIASPTAAPPRAPATEAAHLSTAAFELTVARQPLIVSCGPGQPFGPAWAATARAPSSHATLAIESVSALGGPFALPPPEVREIRKERQDSAEGSVLLMGHDGWQQSLGLTHLRRLMLARSGARLVGRDTLGALSEAERALRHRLGLGEVRFALHFPLHPRLRATPTPDQRMVWLDLPDGTVWSLRSHDAPLTLEPAVYLSQSAAKPLPTRQIVIRGRTTGGAVELGWTLARSAGRGAS